MRFSTFGKTKLVESDESGLLFRGQQVACMLQIDWLDTPVLLRCALVCYGGFRKALGIRQISNLRLEVRRHREKIRQVITCRTWESW